MHDGARLPGVLAHGFTGPGTQRASVPCRWRGLMRLWAGPGLCQDWHQLRTKSLCPAGMRAAGIVSKREGPCLPRVRTPWREKEKVFKALIITYCWKKGFVQKEAEQTCRF